MKKERERKRLGREKGGKQEREEGIIRKEKGV
jgi:hypothetical protein